MKEAKKQSKYRGYIRGQRWSGIMEFLFEATNVGSLELKILKDDKGLIERTIYFEVSGPDIEIDAFIQVAKKAVAEHNGDVQEKEPPHDDKSLLEHDLKGKKLLETAEEINKKHDEKYPDTGSDFGKGFLYCLTMFASHFTTDTAERLQKMNYLISIGEEEREKIFNKVDSSHDYGNAYDDTKFYFERILPIHHGNEKDMLGSEITLWANGSSDHLYELECPEVFKGTEIEKLVEELRDKGLEMGHGRGLLSRDYTFEQFTELRDLTAKIIKLVDKHFGIEVIDARYGEL